MSNSGTGIAEVVLIGIGSLTITLSFWPQFWATYKSRDSSAIPLKIFALHFATSCIIFIGSLISIASIAKEAPDYVKYGFFIYINLFLFATCGYIFYLKITNSKRACRLGISEAEYCKYYAKPLNMGRA